MQSALIIGLMFLAAFAKIATVLRIVLSRLASRYPLFTVMVAFSAMRSVVLLAVGGWAARLHPYLEIWNATLGISYALEAAACFEAFWILVLHFRNVKIFGSIAFLFFGVIGTTLSYSLVAIWSGRWKTALTQTAVLSQHVALALIVFGVLSLLFFRQFSSVPIKPNAIRHLRILTLLFGSLFLSSFFLQSDQHTRLFLANLAINLGIVAAYGSWAMLIRPSGEQLPFPPGPIPSAEEFEDLDARHRVAMNRTVQQARASLENLKRETRN